MLCLTAPARNGERSCTDQLSGTTCRTRAASNSAAWLFKRSTAAMTSAQSEVPGFRYTDSSIWKSLRLYCVSLFSEFHIQYSSAAWKSFNSWTRICKAFSCSSSFPYKIALSMWRSVPWILSVKWETRQYLLSGEDDYSLSQSQSKQAHKTQFLLFLQACWQLYRGQMFVCTRMPRNISLTKEHHKIREKKKWLNNRW